MLGDKKKTHELAEDRLVRLTEVIDAMAEVMGDYQLPAGMIRTMQKCAECHVQSLHCHMQQMAEDNNR